MGAETLQIKQEITKKARELCAALKAYHATPIRTQERRDAGRELYIKLCNFCNTYELGMAKILENYQGKEQKNEKDFGAD